MFNLAFKYTSLVQLVWGCYHVRFKRDTVTGETWKVRRQTLLKSSHFDLSLVVRPYSCFMLVPTKSFACKARTKSFQIPLVRLGLRQSVVDALLPWHHEVEHLHWIYLKHFTTKPCPMKSKALCLNVKTGKGHVWRLRASSCLLREIIIRNLHS